MEETGCKIICGAPTTLAFKRLMMMMMNWKGTSGAMELNFVSVKEFLISGV